MFSSALLGNGARVSAFDVLLNREGGSTILDERRKGVAVNFTTLAEVVKTSEVIISTVTTDVALAAARDCSQFLSNGQIYLDLNSTSPHVKVEMARVIGDTGAGFVEGAVLGAVGATGAATKILLGGELAEQYAAVFSKLGLNTVYFSTEIGKASTFKMIRSVFSKGVEALLLEMLLAAKEAGLESELWTDIVDFMESQPFSSIASNWVRTHAVACERRYYEMAQVKGTMNELGVQPIMTSATVDVFRRSVQAGVNSRFTAKADSVGEVIEFLSHYGREMQGE